MSRAKRVTIREFPGSQAMPVLPEGAACLNHPHPEWWLDSSLITAEGLATGEAAAWICTTCPVLAECAEIAADLQPTQGIWAGVAFVGSTQDAHGRPALRRLVP